MKTFKKVLSVVLALTMVLGTMTFTGVSAADGDTIYEDFGAGFVIGESGITTTSGLTVTAHADVLANENFVTSDKGLYVPGGGSNNTADGLASSGDLKGVNFAFDPITEGTAEISFDLTIVNGGYSHPSTLGVLYGVDAEDAETAVISHKFWTATNATSATTGDVAGHSLFFGDGGYDSSVKVTNEANEKVRATYVINMTDRTVDILVNGTSIGTRTFRTAATSVSEIRFYDDHNCASYIIDNLTVVSDATAAQKTITFEGANADAITTTYGRLVTLPVPDVDGMIFNGWVDEDDNTVANSIIVTEDMNLTADLRDKLIITEKFEDNFTLDVENTRVSTNSGLTVTAGDAFYALNPTADGVLYAKAYTNGNGVTGDMSMTFEFPEIRKGKVKLAFDLAIPETGFSNWMAVHGKPYFTVGNAETGKNAAALYVRGINGTNTRDTEVYLATANGSNGSATNTIGTINGRSSDLANIEYIIDLDNKTYSVTWGGQTYSDIAFAGDATSIDNFTIAFATDGIRNKNCDIIIDNLTIVEDVDNNNFTVTFMSNGEVYEEQTVVALGNAVFPETVPSVNGKVFGGWVTDDGEAVTQAMLKEITADAVYYASLRDITNITEDFSTASVNSTEKAMKSESGLLYELDYVAADDVDTSGIFSITDAGALKIARGTDGNDYHSESVKMNFGKSVAGKVYISFDIKIPNLAYGGHHKGREVARITDGEGNTAASLWIDKGESGYYGWLEAGKNNNGATDDSTIATLSGDTTGYDSFATIEYVLDIDAKTYTVSVDGAKAKTFDFESDSVTGISQLAFNTAAEGTYHYRMNREIDNVTIIENPTGEGIKVTFMNGDEEYATSTVSFGVIDNIPAGPAKSGKAFAGWATANGTVVDESYYSTVVDDTVLYATFRDVLNITEDFGANFSIDYNAKTMTSDSGLTFSSTKETTFDTNYGVKATDSGLSVAHSQGNIPIADVYMTFSKVSAGKLYIAFDLINQHSSNGHVKDRLVFGLGNSKTSEWATTLKAEDTSNFKTEDGAIVPEGKIEYIIDFATGTYIIKAGGAQIGTTHTLADVGAIDAIYLTTGDLGGWYSVPFAIDNLAIKEDPTGEGAKVTFMNGDEEYATATVTFGIIDSVPKAPSVDGRAFLGWATADGVIVDADYYLTVVADTVLYATFRNNLNLVEDFENGFALIPATLETNTDGAYTGNVTTAGSITTNSGFTFSAETANAYGALEVKAANGSNALYNNGYIGLNAKLSDIYMNFPAIYDGKVYLSFDLRIPHYGMTNAAFNNKVFLGIGNAAEGNAVELIKAYNEEIVTVDGVDTSKKTTKVTTENGTAVAYQPTSEYYTYEYVIDLDNGTYSLEISATNGDALTLTDVALGNEVSYIDRIALPQQADANTWYNTPWYIDNVTLVENYNGTVEPPVEPATYTVTFYDEDGTTKLYETTVEEGATAVYAGAAPSKAATAQYTYTFAGWDKALTNITADTTVKATYTQTVNKYKVTFVDHDGTVLKEEDVEYGASATAPADPERDGYTFKGWDGVFTNVVAVTVVTATYEENAAEDELVANTFWETTIEPATDAEYEAIMGEPIEEGLYAWKVKHSLTGLGTLYRQGSKINGYTGRMIAKAQVNLVFGDAVNDVYLYAEPIKDESTFDAGSNYGLNQQYKQFATFWDGAFEASASYPNKNTTVVDTVEDAFVTFLVTKTDTFDLTISGVMQIAEFVADDGTNAGVGAIETYESDEEICKMMIARGEEGYNLFGTNPTTISVVDGVVSGGSEEVAPLTYANGKIVVNSPEDGMLYIISKNSDGIIATQKTYTVTAGDEADYDFTAAETAYLWNNVLDPICNPFTID